MPELALHILDLVQNSVSAKATLIVVTIFRSTEADELIIVIQNNGCGMSEEFLKRVGSPFTTTRTTRKVGLGIPMFKQLAEMCEGGFTIESAPGQGTRLEARFRATHVDLPPMGDLKGTMQTLLIANPETPDFRLEYRVDDRQFVFDTREIRQPLGFLPLNEPEILSWIDQYLSEGIGEVENGSNDNLEVLL